MYLLINQVPFQVPYSNRFFPYLKVCSRFYFNSFSVPWCEFFPISFFEFLPSLLKETFMGLVLPVSCLPHSHQLLLRLFSDDSKLHFQGQFQFPTKVSKLLSQIEQNLGKPWKLIINWRKIQVNSGKTGKAFGRALLFQCVADINRLLLIVKPRTSEWETLLRIAGPKSELTLNTKP